MGNDLVYVCLSHWGGAGLGLSPSPVTPASPAQGGAQSRCSGNVCRERTDAKLLEGVAFPPLPRGGHQGARAGFQSAMSRFISALETLGSLFLLWAQKTNAPPPTLPVPFSYHTVLYRSPPPPGSLSEPQAGSGSCSRLLQPPASPIPALTTLEVSLYPPVACESFTRSPLGSL